jgi:hypothetical protein
MKCEITHSTLSNEEVSKCLQHTLVNRELDFKVSALVDGDYVLSIYVYDNQFSNFTFHIDISEKNEFYNIILSLDYWYHPYFM